MRENARRGASGSDTMFWKEYIRHEREMLLFVLVSALDIFMTWALLRRGGFIESNPIAHYVLVHWGIKGMVLFKFSMVAVVCLVVQLIARRRAVTAQRVLNLATLIVAGVVIYSFTLLAQHAHLLA